MFPNNSQNHSGVPSNLPLVSPNAQTPQQPVQQGQATPPIAPQEAQGSGVNASSHYANQTKRLVAQYGNDPFKLSNALNQLKSAYLSEQFHISANQSDN